MTPHRRRAAPGGSPFTFAADGRDGAHGVEYDAWAEKIKGGNVYFGKSDDLKFGAWSRGAQEKVEGSLWKKADSPGTEARRRYVYRETYPTARSRDIARYRQEMLDMVKDLPESGYELSLRDMVVQPATPPRTPPRKAEEETLVKGKGSPEKETKAAGKDRKGTEKGVKQLSRSENMETGGFFFKMFMPVALDGGGERRKITSGGGNSRTKVSPRPSFEVEKGGSEGSDGEWWRNNELSGSGGSNSSSDNSNTSNSNSSSSSSSNRSRKMKGCFPFLLKDKR